MIWEASFIGKMRIKKKFAWYPRTMNYYTIWLQWYYVLEEFNAWDGKGYPYWEGVYMDVSRGVLEDTKIWQNRPTI